VGVRSEQLDGTEFVEVALVPSCLAVDAVVDGTQNDDGQVERGHRCRYRQVLVGFQKLDVAVVDGDDIWSTSCLTYMWNSVCLAENMEVLPQRRPTQSVFGIIRTAMSRIVRCCLLLIPCFLQKTR